MPLPRPSISNMGGDIPSELQQRIRKLLNEFADVVTALMSQAGLGVGLGD